MSFLVLNEQGATPSNPAATKVKVYADNATIPLLKRADDAGIVSTMLDDKHHLKVNGAGVAVSAAFATDTYLVGSSVLIAPLVSVGACYYCVFDMVKTAAGTATSIITVRYGLAGAIGDTARVTITFAAGTAAADTGIFEVWVTFRSIGAAGILTAMARCTHHLAATGLTSTGASGAGIIYAVSAGFDMTVANSYIGLSFNGGGSFVGTNQMVQATGTGII